MPELSPLESWAMVLAVAWLAGLIALWMNKV